MVWLVQSDLTPTGQPDPRHRSPTCFFHVRATDAFSLECRYLGLQIGARQIELVPDILLGGMNRQFCRRQREDQPTVPRVHG